MLNAIFNYEFMQNAILSAIIISIILPYVGVIVSMRRMNFIADSLGHVNMAAIALTMLISTFIPLNSYLSFLIIIIWTILSSILIEYLREKYKNYKEISLLIVYTISVALTMLFLEFASGYNSSLFNILFGNINAISRDQVYYFFIISLILILYFKKYFNQIILFSLDEQHFKMYNYNLKFIKYTSMIVISITITIAIKIVGVLLVTSLITIPLLSSSNISTSLKKTIKNCIIINLISMLGGIVISYYLNIATSPIVVIIMLIIYLFTLNIKKK